MNRLNLGSGGLPLEGYTNVDISSRSPKVDIVYDLNQYPWPFDDNWADEINMSQCLEHLDDRNAAMKEIYRILKPGCKAKIDVPHFTWQFAYADPTHKHFFAHMTFFYYAGRGRYFDFCFSDCKVKITFGKTLSVWNYLIEPLANLFPNVYEQSLLRMFPAVSVDAVLTK
jgi:SAM-dependent methyltransferase